MRIQPTNGTIYRILTLCFSVVFLCGCAGVGSGGSLGGSSWRVAQIRSVDSLRGVGADIAPTLTFTSDTTFSATSLCNILSGSYLRRGDDVSIWVEAITSAFCADDILESIFVEQLSLAHFCDSSLDTLQFRGEGGECLVRFSRIRE